MKTSHQVPYPSHMAVNAAEMPAEFAADAPEHDDNRRFARHIPVMVTEVLDALQVRPGGVYLDGTLGDGGHLEAVWSQSRPGGLVLAVDADPDAVERARDRFAPYQGIVIAHGNFRDLQELAERHGFQTVNGILLDLGLSTRQLGGGRGFSFSDDASLDMRFDPSQPLTAADVVNRYGEDALARVIRDYGEEPRARSIARAILRRRPIRTARELAQVVAGAAGRSHRINPATRVFQAIRIEVNQELASLELALPQAIRLLGPGGRLAVLSYHSLEDAAVKRAIRQAARSAEAQVAIVGPKLLRPSPEEVRSNPRSRSARLRVAERIAGR